MPRGYIYDQGFSEERARLAGIESLWDPGSQAVLDAPGIAAGWRCLEVGAGGGSLVQWMAGRGATVTAIDTRFLEQLAGDTVEVRRVNVRTGELPQREFDLVHARLVLEHLNDRRRILDRLAAASSPTWQPPDCPKFAVRAEPWSSTRTRPVSTSSGCPSKACATPWWTPGCSRAPTPTRPPFDSPRTPAC